MFSYKYKPAGFVLIVIGFILSIYYSFNKVNISIPVFAIYASYLETKLFTLINNNIFEELIILSILTGFILISFSKEKIETDLKKRCRNEAWQLAIMVNSSILIFATVFIYGKGFIMVLIFNMFSVFILFHFFYWLKKRRLRKHINN